ncbi:hypothetical protein [Desulfofarcimen acetoxidans]|uniref:hypothetical protein n=1 Tax=Desulfofarcimen acetoxidans TaxID=58138 RepID=UPI00019E4EDC|nr:hypothetical protein [Desulfofarcimen acetoxidans]
MFCVSLTIFRHGITPFVIIISQTALDGHWIIKTLIFLLFILFGAAILGDGQLALIVDVRGLVKELSSEDLV